MSNPMHAPRYAILRARLVKLREAKNLTQMDIAVQLGKPQSYVSKYERGERRLDVVELIAIAKVLDADPAQLCAELAWEPLSENFDRIFHVGDNG